MKAIIVEDSKLAREGLITMLREFDQIEIVGEAGQPSKALEMITSRKPDVLFLDIHMPGETGFDLLARLDYSPRIIFTTAYAQYAINSFEFNTVDYLLKPITRERLAQAIGKLEQADHSGGTGNRSKLEINHRIFIKDGDKCHLIPLESIRYLESCKNYVLVYFDNHKAYIKKALGSVEERLPEKYFFRANRQHIVNLRFVAGIEEWFGGGYLLSMDDGTEIKISRAQAVRLKEITSL